ncbi:MAG: protein kinase domain-containing protein [Akkermansiaceae bacterium]
MIDNRYTIEKQIGKGGLGAVYLAVDTVLNRYVAIKRVLVDSSEPIEELTESLIAEAKILSSLNHPNIVTIHDVGQDEEGPYIIMELLNGDTLETIIDRAPLPIEEFKRLATQALEGMIAAQSANLIHRDLKPANIMLVWPEGCDFEVKILDFGLAKFSRTPSTQSMDQSDSILGSIFFMAPEQFENLPLDARTDLYSLGSIFYYTLAGVYPFTGDQAAQVMSAHLLHRFTPLKEHRPSLPNEICAWVESLMALDMNDRPINAQAALEALNLEPAIDEKQLREAASNDPELAKELLSAFRTETAELLVQLNTELTAGESSAAHETAQTIRGTASTLGYTEIISIALKIEKQTDKDIPFCQTKVTEFEPAIERLAKAISHLTWDEK